MHTIIRPAVLSTLLLLLQIGCGDSDRYPVNDAASHADSVSIAPAGQRGKGQPGDAHPSEEGANPIDRERLLEHVRILSSDEYQGREVGTAGGRLAADYVLEQLRATGVKECADAFVAPFEGPAGAGGTAVEARNIVGMVPGTDLPDRFIVITAHFDHLGMQREEIYNGADDNASGTAALIELARSFARHPARHTLIFAALDAEESGLRGARAFLESACGRSGDILQNVNLDMVSRSDAGELYASGTYHYPELRPALDTLRTSSSFDLLFGHDEPGTGSDDWTMASDHGPFHAAGFPFVYFGVEDHAGYHRPSDDFRDITPDFFYEATGVIYRAILALDRHYVEAGQK